MAKRSTDRLPKGILRRGSKFRVSIMVAGVRRTATCDTLEEAVREAERMRQGQGREAAASRLPAWTFQEASDALMRERIEVNTTSRQSLYSRRSTLRQVVAFYGAETSVDTVNFAEVMRLSHHLRVKKGFSPAYTNSLLVTLKMLMDHAWQSGRKSEPPVKIEFVKGKSGRIRYLTRDEEQACLSWCDHHAEDDLRDVFTLLIDTGLRVMELLDLGWRDVDFKAERIHVWTGKSAEPRAVPMTSRVKTILKKRWIAATGPDKARVNHSKVMAGHRYKWLNDKWQRLRAGVGMTEDRQFVLHVLRHTCCTRLVSNGVDLRTVQRWMGHEDIQTTMKYAQFVPDNLFGAARALEPDANSKPDLRVVEGGA